MKTIHLKVSYLYGLYKQGVYFVLIVVVLGLLPYLKIYWQLLIGISAVLALRALYGIIYQLTIAITIYEDHIVVREGVFSHRMNYLELYRVKDYEVMQSFWMRMFGLMSIQLHTSDKTSPIVNFKGIPKSNVAGTIRVLVEKERRLKGVREFD